MTTQFASNGSGGCIGHTVTGFSQEYRAWGESMVALAEKQAAFRARQREVLEQQAEYDRKANARGWAKQVNKRFREE